MTKILNVLLENTIFSAVLFGAIILFQKVFRKHISASLNYAVWTILILRLLIPVTIDSGLHFITISEAQTQIVQAEEPDNISAPNIIQENNASVSMQQTPKVGSNEAANSITNNPVNINNDTQGNAWKFDWQTVLVLLWALGVLGLFGFTLVTSTRLRRRIIRHGEPVPKRVLKLIEECKKDVHIKAKIKVSVQEWLKSPALSSSTKPMLLIPEDMVSNINRQQLEFSIRHELTHYRRKDHLVSLLMLILRCVYWFNPIVWLTFRRIQIDMETACDASVTSRLEEQERINYIKTMIDLTDKPGMQYALGMGMSQGRKSIEKRIRGIFMKRKTKPSVRLAAVALAGIMLIICFTTACQPTPKEEIVVNKGDGELQDIIAGPTASAQAILEESLNENENNDDSIVRFEEWKETYTLPNLVCKIDADVFLPAVDEFPVFKVLQKEFDNEDVKKIVNYFTANATGVRKTSNSKEELEELLLQAKRGHYMWDDNGGRWESYEGQEEYIAELEQQIANAEPEMFDSVTDYDISLPIRLTYAMPDEERMYLDAMSKKICILPIKYGIIQPESWVIVGEAFPGEPVGTTIDNIKISEEEANNTARELLSGLGIENFGIAKTEKARIIKDFTFNIVSEGWQITFTRNDGNYVPVYINSAEVSGLLQYEQEAYISRWQPESITIYVDGNGCRSFYWENPLEVVEEINSNVPIITFDDIKDKIRAYIKYAFAKNTEGREMLEQQIAVKKVMLTNVLLPIMDENTYHMLVPSWVVFYEQEDRVGIHTYVLAINAIDGSSIDLTLDN